MDNQYYVPQTDNDVSIGDWLITMLLCAIPIVNIVMIIVWAATAKKKSKKNWAIATLIVMVIGIVLSFLFGAAIVASIANLAY